MNWKGESFAIAVKMFVLTVVIPTYNMQACLGRCLDSLLVDERSMAQLEVLVINDGSTDDSSAIAHSYEKKYPGTFRVIDKENGNYGSCVNRGLAEARGKYIRILDADDWFESARFQEFLSFLQGQDADLVISDFDQVGPDGSVLNRIHYDLDTTGTFTCSSIPRSILFLSHAVTYKVDNLRKFGYRQSEGIFYTDQEWVFWPMISVRSIRYFDGTIYKYLIGREGQSVSKPVFIQHFSHEMQGAKAMASVYEECWRDLNSEHLSYLRWRLEMRLHLVYYCHLVRAYEGLDIRSLSAFDQDLKSSCPASWVLSQGLRISKRIPYHFIRAFRRFRSKNLPGIILFRLYRKVS